MNYTTLKAIAAIFESLPTFDKYAYFNEPVQSVDVDDDGNIQQINFPCGCLRKRVIRTADGKKVSWLLDNSVDIVSVFLVA